MGGRALQKYGIKTRRYDTPEYLELVKELKPRIEKIFNTEVHNVRSYNTKESHGDMDLLILNDGNLGKINEKLIANFKDVEIVNCNGGVFSFAYKDFQIDIIPQPISKWEVAKCFFDSDPTGNLMGKLAHKFGLKYGFAGLVYPFRNYDGIFTKDITISLDNAKIFKFLGLDYNRYLQTFDTLLDIFDYIINSKYFNVDNYIMSNLNSIDRKRNIKRKTYQEFLTYVNLKQNENINKYEFSKNKEDYLQMINDYFPEANLLVKLNKFKLIDIENKNISKKFNGNTVIELFPECTDRKLGQVLYMYKEFLGEAYIRFMLNSTSEEIKSNFSIWYKKIM
jgi:hypothetical protein